MVKLKSSKLAFRASKVDVATTGTFAPPSEAEYNQSNAWGLATAVDIQDCNPALIRDAEAIKRFTKELCKRLGVKMFGETIVVDFGADPKVSGFSLVQLIETSLVSGHFANQTNAVYLDVFSCKFYDAQKIIDYALSFFQGKSYNAHCVLRGCDEFPGEYLEKFADRNIVLSSKASR
jgi:S-adenosylmethionine/arginine decarboxylase-like enzyme